MLECKTWVRLHDSNQLNTLANKSFAHADYALFLSPTFEPRSFAQGLLNGTAPTTASTNTGISSSLNPLNKGKVASEEAAAVDQAESWTLDKRSLEALQQLGLSTASGSNHAGGSNSESKALERTPSSSNHYNAFSRTSSGPGDVSAALSKLSFAVDDLNKQLRSEINTHHSALLVQAGSVSSLEENLRQIRGGLDEVESSADRLRRKIALPYETLSTSLTRLAKLQGASDLARRASRFVVLARRLDVQMADLNAANTRASQTRTNGTTSGRTTPNGVMSKDAGDRDGGERALSEAALTLAELGMYMLSACRLGGLTYLAPHADVLMDASESEIEGQPKLPSIRNIQAIEHHFPAVEANRARVVDEMEVMVRRGLQELVSLSYVRMSSRVLR